MSNPQIESHGQPRQDTTIEAEGRHCDVVGCHRPSVILREWEDGHYEYLCAQHAKEEAR